MDPGIHYFPLAGPAILLLLLLLGLLVVLTLFRVLRFAYSRIGIAPQYFFGLMVLTLIGSYVNIPIFAFPEAHVLSPQEVTVFGVPYIVPMLQQSPGTVLAINVGGGLIPILLSLYLLVKNRISREAGWGILVVTVACYLMATPVPGVGIAIPLFYPMIIAAVVSLVISRPHAAPLAYVSGTLGTLIGADLLNLPIVAQMEAPVMSIGGAGTFDAIFLTGLMAGVLASIGRRRVAV